MVFFGSQWGTKATDGHGNVTLSHDSSGEAPYLQRLLKGLGTNGDGWSGIMTQYCDGAPFNAQSCTADTLHVGYPAKGALRGVWVDAFGPGFFTTHRPPAWAEGSRGRNKIIVAAPNSRVQADFLRLDPLPVTFPPTTFAWWDSAQDPPVTPLLLGNEGCNQPLLSPS